MVYHGTHNQPHVLLRIFVSEQTTESIHKQNSSFNVQILLFKELRQVNAALVNGWLEYLHAAIGSIRQILDRRPLVNRCGRVITIRCGGSRVALSHFVVFIKDSCNE